MNSAEHQKEFILPTRYKSDIGSYLSWPVGAKELTKSFSHVPQIKDIQIEFWESYPKHPKGKWPASFPVIEVTYSRPRVFGNFDWEFHVYPVPRNVRSEVRESLAVSGFKVLAEWLFEHAKYSGRESHLRFTGIWNSDSKELTFGSRDYVLPEVADRKTKRK